MDCGVGEEYLASLPSSTLGSRASSKPFGSCRAPSSLQPKSSIPSQEQSETAITLLTQLMGQLTKEAEADGSQTPGGNANNTAALLTYTTALILCDFSLWQQARKDGIAVPGRSSVNLLATGYSQDLQKSRFHLVFQIVHNHRISGDSAFVGAHLCEFNFILLCLSCTDFSRNPLIQYTCATCTHQ